MKNRLLSTLSLIVNIAIVVLVVLCVISFHTEIFGKTAETPISVYLYFTVMSNLLLGLVALIEIPFFCKSIAKRRYLVPMFLHVAKLVAVTATTITMGTALSWLSIQLGFDLMIQGANLFLHLITPAIALFSFIFFESQARVKFRNVLFILIPMVLYTAFYFGAIFLFNIGSKDWYMFAYDYVEGVQSENVNVLKSVLSIVIFLVGPVLLAMLIWSLNHLLYRAYFVRKPLPRPEDTVTPEGKKVVIIEEDKTKPFEEDVVEEEPVESVALTEEVEDEDDVPEAPEYRNSVEIVEDVDKPKRRLGTKKAPAKKKSVEKVEEKKSSPKKKSAQPVAAAEYGKYEGKTRVYHISQSKTVDGQWQVKLAGGDKAVKLFKTQKEAIEYAKGLVRTQGGSIRIHSMKGKMRK